MYIIIYPLILISTFRDPHFLHFLGTQCGNYRILDQLLDPVGLNMAPAVAQESPKSVRETNFELHFWGRHPFEVLLATKPIVV